MAVFFPHKYYGSAYDVPYKDCYEEGARGVIFDIDNTLVCHGAPVSEEALKLMDELKSLGYRICFLSNNREPRVKSFNEKIGAVYIFNAGKPNKDGYLKACKLMGTEPHSTIFVGDQIFTDIWGANNANIKSFLVRRIGPKEEIQIHLKRILEAPIILAFKLFHRDRCFM